MKEKVKPVEGFKMRVIRRSLWKRLWARLMGGKK